MWLSDRLAERRIQYRDTPISQWHEYQELGSTVMTFSLNEVASRSFARDFTPADLVSIAGRFPHLNFRSQLDILDKDKFDVRQSLIAQAYRDWDKDPIRPYCWSILEGHEEFSEEEGSHEDSGRFRFGKLEGQVVS